ncbi:MAG: hypothetical protein IT376_02220 [Polyangiaceae bacterium]|nr:hypothetical protein [Polyangiaceae bacterium]
MTKPHSTPRTSPRRLRAAWLLAASTTLACGQSPPEAGEADPASPAQVPAAAHPRAPGERGAAPALRAPSLGHASGIPGAPSGGSRAERAAWVQREQLRSDASYAVSAAAGALEGRNAANGFAVAFQGGGFELSYDAGTRALSGRWQPARPTPEPVRLAFRLERWGAPGALAPAPAPARTTASGNRVELDRGALVEWYVNGRLGLEQGFTIAAPPEDRAGLPLVLELGVEGDGTVEAAGAGGALALVSREGVPWASYGELYVSDASGAELPARLEASGRGVRIVVEAARAEYPIEIDPTIWIQQGELAHEEKRSWGDAGRAVGASGTTVIVGAPSDTSTPGQRGTAYVFVQAGTAWAEQAELRPTLPGGDESFGASVGITGSTAVVGAPNASVAYGSGRAYVFVRSGTSWAQQAQLEPPQASPANNVGSGAAVGATTVLLGAPWLGAYVFERAGTTWAYQQTLNANQTAGTAVALSGTTAAVGANYDGTIANQAGAVHVYVRSGTTWTEQQQLFAADAQTGDFFGSAVALENNVLVVGAAYEDDKGNDAGAAYVFVRSGTTWAQQQKLVAADGSGDDKFGRSVALIGTTALVGAPGDANAGSGSGYVFVRAGTSWTQQQKLASSSGGLGTSAALLADLAILGAPSGDGLGAPNSSSGDARVFARSGTAWTEQATLGPSDTARGDRLGTAVGATSTLAVAGAPADTPRGRDSGSVVGFRLSGGLWVVEPKLTPTDGAADDFFGGAVDLDGSTLLVGAAGHDAAAAASGAAYVFTRSGTGWAQQQKLLRPSATGGEGFGTRVALSGTTLAVSDTVWFGSQAFVYARSGTAWSLQGQLPKATYNIQGLALDGATLALGTDYATTVDVWTRTGTTWALQQSLTAPGGSAQFGNRLALTGTGTTLAVAAYEETDSRGAVYVYTRAGTVWSQQQRLVASDGATGDLFGMSLAAEGSRLVVGASGADGTSNNAGAAYVFDRAGTTWSQLVRLGALDASTDDILGSAVALSGDLIVAGASQHNHADDDSGAAYAFLYTDPLPDGQPCSSAGACQSGDCVDGYCCDTPCTGSCEACSVALKGSGANGACGPIAAGTDPGNDCTAQPASTCGNTGACDGASGCQKHTAGTVCLAPSCAGQDAQNEARTCNGAGTCVDNGSTPCPSGFACVGVACVTTCANDGECATTHYCDTGTGQCVLDDPPGTPCSAPDHCATGYCVDGVCCATACDTACNSCNAGLTGGTNGACAPILADTDPLGDCPEDVVSSCQRDGLCDGAGQCRPYYPSGTVCGATTCSSDVLSGATCNGSGSCGLGSSPCHPYRCASGSSCHSSCTSDLQCQASAWCRITDNTCQPDLPNGQTCTSAAQCTSGNCVDGVCCNTSCTGGCQACTAAKKGGGANGTCGSIAAGADPDNECTDQGSSSCGTNGACSGAGACALYPPGTACGSTSCASGTQQGNTCNGFGTCTPASTTQCAPYTCLNASVCATSCSDDTFCIASAFCDTTTSTCTPDKPSGQACTADNQCTSGFCTDGVCCDQRCGGLCRACTAALKGSGSDGTCGFVGDTTDPEFECPDDGSATCDRDGMCNGAGACRLYAAGTACGATTCASGTQTGFSCDGFGTCASSQNTSCSPYTCQGSACGTSCTADTECIGSHFCGPGGVCTPDQANGSACATGSQCATGYCVDGVCCDSPCSSTVCQACSSTKKGAGSDGVCGPVAADSDPDNECPDDGATACGRDGSCSGAGACRLYTGGTACGSTTCNAGTQTGFACNGSGLCQSAQNTQCTPYQCAGSACGTVCASDLDCVAGAHCSASSECILDLPNGAACAGSSQCTSGNCVDGVCCDQACTGGCRACSAVAKGAGADGTCEPVLAGTDPDDDCSVEDPTSCQKDGQCDGAGACRLYGLGTVCGSATCAGSTLTGNQCNGLGSCVPGSVSTCAPYNCASGSSCGVVCATGADCVPGSYCAGGACIAKLADGLACSSGAECASGFCVDGVCCNTSCDGLCQACSAATKASAGADGTCGDAASGQDPHDDCPDDGPQSCDRNGACDGSGQCALYAAATQCGAGRCEGGATSGWTATTSSCDGTGACLLDMSTDCGLFGCSSGLCVANCGADGDCARGAICAAGTCAAPAPLGDPCTEGRECVTGLCVDGVCCDGSCTGQCEACDVAGALGRCVPVLGAPHGARAACAAATGDDPCAATECNGSLRGSCAGFAGPSVQCRAASCADGVATVAASCSGTGTCPAATTFTCEPYACGGDACATTCTTDAECNSEYRCSGARCVARGAECADDFTLKTRNDDLIDCNPYKCEGQACRDSCVQTIDCALGFLCSGGECVPESTGGAGAKPADDGGCGCRAPGARDTPRGASALALAALVLTVARRRRRA